MSHPGHHFFFFWVKSHLQFGHLWHRGRNLNNGFFPVQLFAALDFKPHRRRQALPTLVLWVSRSPAEAVTGIHDEGNSQRDHIEKRTGNLRSDWGFGSFDVRQVAC
ncbi:MAG: hypothetical protein DMG52_07920 [Acidobacteria bacterium]|nr:MAG: hypothetical protein DMG52_07920 [Acidobacteriota bacterium]